MPAKVKVRLFHELRATVGRSEVELEAGTLSEVVKALVSMSNPVNDLLYDSQGKLRSYTLFYVNNLVQNPPDLSRKLDDGDLILLVPPAAGG